MIASLAFCLVATVMSQTQTFEESLPDHLVKWKMVKLPDNKEFGVQNLWFSETEVPWELFDVWALRLDQSQEQQAIGVDATSRPSKPYSVIFTNFGHHTYPAICMSFLNAQKFCEWLSQKTGRKYRLPTEVEWEYACNAGTADKPDMEKSAWTWENAEDVTHPDGKKQPNARGLMDMLGNAAEWCVAKDGKPVVKGGSWKTKAKDITTQSREEDSPKWNEADPQNPKSKWWLANGQFIGMRIVCEGSGKIEP